MTAPVLMDEGTKRSPSLISPFHYAFYVNDLEAARTFYTDVLGCHQGRSSGDWIDFNLFGHEIVAHLRKTSVAEMPQDTSPVDGIDVPIPHFGVVLPWEDFFAFADRLRGRGVTFAMEPTVRFEGKPGEQSTMFFLDPSGNALEFKSFRNPDNLFTH